MTTAIIQYFAGSCMAIVRLIHLDAKCGKISLAITCVEGLRMPSDLLFSVVPGVFLILLLLLPR
jgi:hypothetical protein